MTLFEKVKDIKLEKERKKLKFIFFIIFFKNLTSKKSMYLQGEIKK